MALTPAIAFGKIELEYSAYGVPHKFRAWVSEFGVDPGVGTFSASGSPASLDALATELTGVIKPIYNADSALSWGAWRGIKTTSIDTGAGVPVVEGTITPASASFDTTPNPGQAVSQATWAFRDAAAHLMRFVHIGAIYVGPIPFKYSSLSGGYLALANYYLGSARIVSKNDRLFNAMIDLTFDTNDGLTRRLRR